MPLRYEDPPSVGPLRQGEILGDVFEHRVTYAAIASARPRVPVTPIIHPLVVVLNNVCDLQRDFDARAEEEERGTESGAEPEAVADEVDVQTADREEEAEEERVTESGAEPEAVADEVDVQTSDRKEEAEEHQSLVPYVQLCALIGSEKLLRRPYIGVKILERMRKLEDARYHCLPTAAVGDGDPLPELFVDFKKTFAMPTPSLYEGMRAGGVKRIAVVPPIYLHDLIQRYHAFHSRVGLPD